MRGSDRNILDQLKLPCADVLRSIRPLQDRLDRMVAALQSGVLSQRQYDDLDHEAHSIATAIRAAFRNQRGKS